jgi:hypothetical protein
MAVSILFSKPILLFGLFLSANLYTNIFPPKCFLFKHPNRI